MCMIINSHFKGYVGYHYLLLVRLIKVFEIFRRFHVLVLDIGVKNQKRGNAGTFLTTFFTPNRLS